MKNLCTLFSLFILAAAPATAQTGLSISIQGGPQRTDMRCDRFITENRTGYTTGIGAAYGITNRVSLGIDAMYSSEGRRMDFKSIFGSGDQDFRERIGYLKVPVYIAYSIRPGKTISFSARLGPQFSYLLHAEGYDRTQETVIFPDTKAAYTKFNPGAMAGFDVRARLSRAVSLSLGLRADMTFTDTEAESFFSPTLNDSYTRNINAGAWLGLHYRLVRSAPQGVPPSGS